MRAIEQKLAACRHLVEQVDDGYGLFDVLFDADGNPADLRLDEANPSCFRFFGWSRDDATGRTLGELLPEDLSAWTDACREAIATGRAARFERHTPDGGRCLAATLCTVGEGRVAVWLCDVTVARQARQAEASLRDYADSLDFLSGTAQKMLEPLSRAEIYRFVTDRIHALTDGAMVLFNEFDFVNRKTILREFGATGREREIATRVFGRDPIGTALDFPEAIRERFIPGGFERLEGGLCELAFQQLPPALCDAIESALEVRSIYAMACSVEEDILGTVAILAHSREPLRNQHLIESIVTQAAVALQRRRAEENLQVERDFIDAVLDTEAAIVAVLDTGHRIVRMNRAYYELAGCAPGSVLGQPFSSVMESGSTASVEAQLEALARESVTGDYQTLMTVRKGNPRLVRWRNTAMRDERGALRNIIATGTDVTAQAAAEQHVRQLNRELRRRAAELEQANRELETFSYTVTHDLRRPLRAMIGLGEILVEDYGERLDEGGRETVRRIVEAGQQMNCMVDDILSLATVSRKDLKTEHVDLSAIAQAVVADLHRQQPERRVTTELRPTAPVEGDAGLLSIALANLLGNAWKYTLKSATPRIEFGSVQQQQRQVFYVRDNGVGFDMGDADRLFRPFERLHADKAFTGTGIGLATVARIVERHGGRVWAEAEEGKGATFYFVLGTGG